MCYELELPFPPTLNHYRLPVIRRTKAGKQYASFITSPDGVAYKAKIRTDAKNPPGYECDVHVSLVFFPKTKAKFDVDNFLKPLFDGLTEAGVWKDDSQVWSMYVEKGEVVKGGKVFIKISKITKGN
tara:strand:- start:755 stop:1135 length:381 start_codon:yes stop_codon:yes gene_type:complete